MEVLAFVRIVAVIAALLSGSVENEIERLQASSHSGGMGALVSTLKLAERVEVGEYSRKQLAKDFVISARHTQLPLKTVFPQIYWDIVLKYKIGDKRPPSKDIYTLVKRAQFHHHERGQVSRSDKALMKKCLSSANPNDWPLALTVLFSENHVNGSDLSWFMKVIRSSPKYSNDPGGRLKSLRWFASEVLR